MGAVWALLQRFKIRRRYQAVLFIGFCATGFFYLNLVFVWPKLLAGGLAVATVIDGRINVQCPFTLQKRMTRELTRFTDRHPLLAMATFLATGLGTMGILAWAVLVILHRH